jgi:hypothetical protein
MINTTAPDPDDSRIAPPPRELDSRISDAIHVQLLWYPHDGHISVAVTDSKTGEMFELEVRHDHRPLDVFHHPYAYRAETHDWERLAAQSPR